MSYSCFTECLSLEVNDRDTFIKYSVTGGIPRYWNYAETRESGFDFIGRIFFSDFAYFENEPYRILKDEKIGGMRPLSVLEAIGRGASIPSEIAKRLSVRQTDIGRPLQALLDSSIIQRDLPFGESIRSTKKVLYSICDPMIRFWFYVYSPHRSRLHLYSRDKKREIVEVLSFEDIAASLL